MRLQINNARGYRFRRYAALTKIATAAWTVFASMVFFTQPDVADFFLAVAVAAFGVVPGLMFATMFDDIAAAEFEVRIQS